MWDEPNGSIFTDNYKICTFLSFTVFFLSVNLPFHFLNARLCACSEVPLIEINQYNLTTLGQIYI